MKKETLLLLLTVLLISGNTFAQGGGEQPPGVPLDQHAIFAMILAIGIALIFIAKKKNMQKSSSINL